MLGRGREPPWCLPCVRLPPDLNLALMTSTEWLVVLNKSGGILDQQQQALYGQSLLSARITARGGGRVPPQHPRSFPEPAVSVGPRVGTIMDSEVQFGDSDL